MAKDTDPRVNSPAIHGLFTNGEPAVTMTRRVIISVPTAVRDRLRGLGPAGMSDADTMTWPMDETERTRFVAKMRRRAGKGDFVPLERPD